MKTALLLIGGLLALVLNCTSPQLASAGESAFVSVRDLPAEIRRAADATFTEVSWLVARRDSRGWYALGGLNNQRKFVEFRCDGQGTNGYFRITIKADEVPANVESIRQTNYPDAVVTRIQSAGQADGRIVAYRFEASNLPPGSNCFYISARGHKTMLGND